MQGKFDSPTGVSQNYQRFAWGTLALAAVVALASTDRGDAAAAAAPVPVSAAPAPPKIMRAPVPVQPVQLAEADEPGETASDSALDAAAAGPVLADGTTPSAAPAAPDTAPLVASSRVRSGGVAQGDETPPRAEF